MKFIFSIMILASIAGALIVLYIGANSLLKVNHSPAEDQAVVANKAATMIARVAQNHGAVSNGSLANGVLANSAWANAALAKVKSNDNALFDLLKTNPFSLPSAPVQSGSVAPWVAGYGFDLGG